MAPLASWLGPWADAVSQHHERFDGTGYPCRLAGEDISLGGRIVAVIDTYDVITSARPTSGRLLAPSPSRARPLRRHPLRPDIVDAFVNISTGRVRFAAGPLAGARPAALRLLRRPDRRRRWRRAPRAAALPAATTLAVSAIVTAGPVAAATNRAQPATGVSVTSSGPAGTSRPELRVVDTGRRPARRQPDHDRGDRLPAVIGPGSVAHDPVGLGISGRLAGLGTVGVGVVPPGTDGGTGQGSVTAEGSVFATPGGYRPP